DIVVGAGAAVIGRGHYRVFIVSGQAAGGRIFAEALTGSAAAGAIGYADRSAALREEQRRERPAAEHVAEHTLLRLVDIRPVVGRDVENHRSIEQVRTVARAQVERIERGV